MRRTTFTLFFMLLSLTPAPGQELFPGWTAGPAADATMDKGRRFDCTGPACPPGGLACLHAATPAGDKLWREVPTRDLARPKGMPWKEIEGWLAAKLLALQPDLAATPAADATTWTVADPARLAGGEAFVAKRYAAPGASVPTAFWMEAGRLNVLVCAAAQAEAGAARVGVERLVGMMR